MKLERKNEKLNKSIVIKVIRKNATILHLCWTFQLPSRETFNCVSLRQFSVYTRHAGDLTLQLVKSSELSTRTVLTDIDPYSNLTVGVSLVNSAGLESRVEQVLVVGSKHSSCYHSCYSPCHAW